MVTFPNSNSFSNIKICGSVPLYHLNSASSWASPALALPLGLAQAELSSSSFGQRHLRFSSQLSILVNQISQQFCQSTPKRRVMKSLKMALSSKTLKMSPRGGMGQVHILASLSQNWPPPPPSTRTPAAQGRRWRHRHTLLSFSVSPWSSLSLTQVGYSYNDHECQVKWRQRQPGSQLAARLASRTASNILEVWGWGEFIF